MERVATWWVYFGFDSYERKKVFDKTMKVIHENKVDILLEAAIKMDNTALKGSGKSKFSSFGESATSAFAFDLTLLAILFVASAELNGSKSDTTDYDDRR